MSARSLDISSGQYIYRSASVAGDAQKFTIAGWIKFNATTGIHYFSSFGDNGGPNTSFAVIRNSNGTLEVRGYVGGGGSTQLVTTATTYGNDTTTWHHFCVGVDTTQATAANRVHVYWDGTEITSWSTSTYPSQNANALAGGTWYFGTPDWSPGAAYPNVKLDLFYFIQGQQLTPSSFIDTSIVPAQIAFGGSYGTNGFKLDFEDNTSTTTLGYDTSGNSKNWSLSGMTTSDSFLEAPPLSLGDAAPISLTWQPLGTPALKDVAVFVANPISLTMALPTLKLGYVLTANALTMPAPTLGAPIYLGQSLLGDPPDLTVAVPPLGTPILTTPNMLRQGHFRFRTDAGAVDATPTWGAAEDDANFNPGTNTFRLRVVIASDEAFASANLPLELRVSKNGGAYNPVTVSSNDGVRSADASSDADETALTIARLTPPA